MLVFRGADTCEFWSKEASVSRGNAKSAPFLRFFDFGRSIDSLPTSLHFVTKAKAPSFGRWFYFSSDELLSFDIADNTLSPPDLASRISKRNDMGGKKSADSDIYELDGFLSDSDDEVSEKPMAPMWGLISRKARRI